MGALNPQALASALTSFDPNAITYQKTAGGLGPAVPVAPGGGEVSWAGQNLGTPTPFTPGTPLSISTNTGNPLQTQGYGNYSIDPKTGQYVLTSSVAPQASDANSLLDQIIRGGSQAALATMGGLAGASAAGLTNGATTLFGGANPLFGAGAAAPAAAPATTGADVGTGGMTFDNSGLVQGISDSASASSAPQIASDATTIANQGAAGIAADTAGSGLTSSQLNLAKNLLNLGKTALQGTPVGQQRVGSPAAGVGAGAPGGFGQGVNGLSDNLQMMLLANAQAKMNGQPLPFPGMGGMGQ